MAWDGVADAIDVSNSHWYLANVVEFNTNSFDDKDSEDKTNKRDKCASQTALTRSL